MGKNEILRSIAAIKIAKKHADKKTVSFLKKALREQFIIGIAEREDFLGQKAKIILLATEEN